MPHLHKFEARLNQVFVSFREWDGIDRPDLTTVILTLDEARSWSAYLETAIKAAERNDEQMKRNRILALESERRQCEQKLQAIADELSALAERTSHHSAPDPDANGKGYWSQIVEEARSDRNGCAQ